MKKIALLSLLLLLFNNMYMFAQGNEIDAYTLSTTEINGTARSMAMGGAFGALGGDVSVLSGNPAGLGIYRSSEISGTLDLSNVKTTTNWTGNKTEKNKSGFTADNFAFTLYFPTSSEGVKSWNFGFSYNRLKNFKRSYKMIGKGLDYSMADFAAWRASNAFGYGNGITQDELKYVKGGYDPYENRDLMGQWLPILGYESGMYDHFAGRSDEYQSSFGWRSNGDWVIDSPYQNALRVNESGYMDEYNFGMGFNISNFMYLGAVIAVTDIDYRYSSFYEDFFAFDSNKDDYLFMENRLNTKGTAVSANIGVITNFQKFRLGVAYHSPRLFTMTDYYGALAGTEINGLVDQNGSPLDPKMENETPTDSYSEYKFRTPDKWIFSGALILGQSALISADYELMNYKTMLYTDRKGNENETDDFINEDFTWSHTLKIGTEIKATPQFALRAGYVLQTSPMREALANNDVEVYPAGTIPHFTVTSNPTHYLTAGLGYRFNPNFYVDLACIYRFNNSDAYAFSNTYAKNGKIEVFSESANLKTHSTRLVMTLGYKF